MDSLYFYLLALVISGHLGPSSTAHRFTLFIYVYNDVLFAEIRLKVSNLWLVLLRHYDKPIQFTQWAPQQCNNWNPMVPSKRSMFNKLVVQDTIMYRLYYILS